MDVVFIESCVLGLNKVILVCSFKAAIKHPLYILLQYVLTEPPPTTTIYRAGFVNHMFLSVLVVALCCPMQVIRHIILFDVWSFQSLSSVSSILQTTLNTYITSG